MEDQKLLVIYFVVIGIGGLLATLIAVFIEQLKKVKLLLQEKKYNEANLNYKIERLIERKVNAYHETSREFREYTKVLERVKELLQQHEILKSNQTLVELFNSTDTNSLTEQEKYEKLLNTKINDLDFGKHNVRIQNVINAGNEQYENFQIIYLKDLIKYSANDLLKLRNMGETSLEEIEIFLAEHKLSLRM